MPAGEGQHLLDDLILRCDEVESVEAQEDDGGQKRSPLVTVSEGMIRGDPESVVSCEPGQLHVLFVAPTLPSSGESRLQGILVSKADQTAVLADLIQMDGFNDESGNPAGLGSAHLASSRSAF